MTFKYHTCSIHNTSICKSLHLSVGSALRITLATLESAIAENGRSGDEKFPTFVQLADAQLVEFLRWFWGEILEIESEKSGGKVVKPETRVFEHTGMEGRWYVSLCFVV